MRRPFADTLRELRGGFVLDELADQLQKLVNAVTSTEKSGSLTLTLEVKPFSGADGAMVIRDQIKIALPKIEGKGTVMFATPEGNLQRKNPKQDELPGISLATSKEQAR